MNTVIRMNRSRRLTRAGLFLIAGVLVCTAAPSVQAQGEPDAAPPAPAMDRPHGDAPRGAWKDWRKHHAKKNAPMRRGGGPEARERHHEIERLRHEDPEGFKIAMEVRRLEKTIEPLAARYRQARTDEERAAIAAELRPKLEEAFDLRTQLRARVLKNIERRLEKARNDLTLRKKNKAQIIDAHFNRITGKTAYMEW